MEPEPAAFDLRVPSCYTLVSTDENGVPLYAFTDRHGIVVYRTTGVVRTLIDGELSDEAYAIYEANRDGEIASTEPIDPDAEQPGVCTPASLANVRLKKGCVPAEQTGSFLDTRNDLFASVVYGTFGHRDAAFYPADENGSMLPGALPLEESLYAINRYAPSDPPKQDGDRHITVFIGTQSVVVFIAKDGNWEIEHVFICSTGLNGKYTPRGEFRITAQTEYKAMSTVKGFGMVYAQYSSRFKGHYLFHTVPAAGEYKNYFPNGKQQMIVAEYEKLGTDVSHGCVRMLVGDCYWIYRNCKVGTGVTVTDEDGPLPPEKPKLFYAEPYMSIDGVYGWDPTDPSPLNPYRKLPDYDEYLIVPTLIPEKQKTPRPTAVITPSPTPKRTPFPVYIPNERFEKNRFASPVPSPEGSD